MELRTAIQKVVDREDLSSAEVSEVFGRIMDGEATPAQIGGLLIGLRMKGVTADEIAGAARSMRERALPIHCEDPDHAVDTCGTGGDGSGSVNVSTMAAIVTAAAGGLVAKHGNRALSSRSGSADVLEALGVAIDVSVETVETCMRELGIGFLFAPSFHAATRHASAPRRELGTRTMFNLLGPLTNPARARNQVIGVFGPEWCRPVTEALGALGARRIFVVHGEGGIDEIAVRGKTLMCSFDEESGKVEERYVTPADFGLEEVDDAGLAGGDAAANADFARRLFAGERGAGRNAVIMESAVALCACGIASSLKDGAKRAAEAVDSGKAIEKLEALIRLTNAPDPAGAPQ
ncbi:MAG: anthranilate phosphoribosyltransferase [Myxococcales bacterium]|nr:anthranilate phosphoribosyltransferase [Myxococcales bacterium]